MPLDRMVPELGCTNLERSLDFYISHLDFRILYHRPEDKFAFLERETTQIMLEQLGVGRNWITGELQHPFGRGMSFQIPVNDVDALYAKLQKAGHSFFLPMEEKWYRRDTTELGNRQFLIEDPDGYLLRFAQNLGSRQLNS